MEHKGIRATGDDAAWMFEFIRVAELDAFALFLVPAPLPRRWADILFVLVNPVVDLLFALPFFKSSPSDDCILLLL